MRCDDRAPAIVKRVFSRPSGRGKFWTVCSIPCEDTRGAWVMLHRVSTSDRGPNIACLGGGPP